MSQLISLQGYLIIGERLASGRPGRQWWAGNVPEAQLELSQDNNQKFETFSGNRALYGSLPGQKAGRITGSFDEWKTENLALGLYSTRLSVASGAVTDEPLPPGLATGDLFSLDFPYATGLTITDGEDAPVLMTNFKAMGHNQRTYEVIGDLSGYEEPLVAAYSYAAQEGLEVFSTTPQEVYVIFDGINTVTGEGVIYDLYRTRFDPFENTGLIHEEFGSLAFGADILVDALHMDGSGKGGYYRFRRKAVVGA